MRSNAIWYVVILLAIIIGMLLYTEDIATTLGVAFIFVLIWIYAAYYNKKIKNEEWVGTIESIKDETIQQDEDNYQTYTYAHIRLSNGKKKKLNHQPGWQVGDRIEKKKGETAYRKIE